MKKLITALTVLAASMLLCASADAIDIYVDGQKLQTPVPAFIEDDRTLVPMRAIFEGIGAKVEWDNASRTAYAFRDNSVLTVPIGSDTMFLNYVDILLDVPSKIVDDRTFVPLRAVSENLNCDVEWNGEKREIYIKTPPIRQNITTLFKENEVKDNDGRLIIKTIISYPYLAPTEPGAEAFNNYFAALSEKTINEDKENLKYILETVSDSIKAGDSFSPVYSYLGYDMTASTPNLSEITCVFYDTSFGNMGDRFPEYLYFDFGTGKEYHTEDIINIAEADKETLSIFKFFGYDAIHESAYAFPDFESSLTIADDENFPLYLYIPINDETKKFLKYDFSADKWKNAEKTVTFEELLAYNDEEGENLEPTPDDIMSYLGFSLPDIAELPEEYRTYYILYENDSAGYMGNDDDGNFIRIDKCEGDRDVILVPDTANLKESKVLGDSYTAVYEYPSDEGLLLQANFTVETNAGLFCYSVITDKTDDLSFIEDLCLEIINTVK